MATTYEKIATTTLGSATSTINFTSIGSSYTDLRLVLVVTATIANRNLYLRFNSDSASNYSSTYLVGNGTAASSGRTTVADEINVTTGASTLSTTIPSLFEIDVFSYAGSTFKTALISNSEDRNGSGSTARVAGLWRSTSAITSVNLTISSDDFATGTTATLYGILKA